MNWQTYLPTPEQVEADKALVDAALERLINYFNKYRENDLTQIQQGA